MTTTGLRERRSPADTLGRGLAVVVVIVTAIALGFATEALPRGSAWVAFAAIPVLLFVGFVVASGPRACLALLVLTAVLGMNTNPIGGGQNGLRVLDICWLALVGSALLIRAREGPILGREVGQRQVGLLMAALLISLYPVVLYAPGGFGNAFVAWVRLAETVSLVWLVPYAVRKIGDLEFMLGVIELSAAAAVLFAIAQAAVDGDLGGRLSGASGPNTTGLLAALLIAASIHAPVPRHRGARVLLFAVGLAGLLMSKSVGSLAALGVMLGLFGLVAVNSPRSSPHRALLTPARVVLLVLAVLAIAATLRPGSLPGSSTFESSTTLHRTVLATAGLELFRDHPVVGVGWSRGPYEIGSDTIDRRLRERFGPDLRPVFLPKENPTSVHNAYIEILAEAGLVGFACLIALLVVAVRGIRSILRSVAADPRVSACAWCAVTLLVGVLVWWNDNTLFGAQPETVLAATLLGMLAATPAVRRGRAIAHTDEPSAVGEPRRLSA